MKPPKQRPSFNPTPPKGGKGPMVKPPAPPPAAAPKVTIPKVTRRGAASGTSAGGLMPEPRAARADTGDVAGGSYDEPFARGGRVKKC